MALLIPRLAVRWQHAFKAPFAGTIVVDMLDFSDWLVVCLAHLDRGVLIGFG